MALPNDIDYQKTLLKQKLVLKTKWLEVGDNVAEQLRLWT